MSAVIAAVVAFVVSLALSTGLAVMRHKPEPPAPAGTVAVAKPQSPAEKPPVASAPVASTPVASAPVASPPTSAVIKPTSPPAVAPPPAKPAQVSTATVSPAPAAAPVSAATDNTPAATPGVPTSNRVTASVVSAASQQPAAYKQLGKVLTNMKPTDAAKVLSYLTDDEVTTLLRELSPRTAAALMAALPQDRAGHLGQRMLVSQ